MNLIDIMPALAVPFAITDIDFLPKNHFEKNGKVVCLSLPFADKRVYEDRLNEVCPGEWTTQTSITVAGNKIIAVVTVTILDKPHTDVGEAAMGENAATEAFAQAFKRACSQVGLGRFLYAVEKQYIPWDATKKRFTVSASDKLAIVKAMYRQAGILSTVPIPADSPATQEQLTQIGALAREKQRKVTRPATYGEAQTVLAELQSGLSGKVCRKSPSYAVEPR